MDSQLDNAGNQGRRSACERKSSLTRSQTDSNITYSGEEPPEAPGSAYFITQDGDLDLEVILQVFLRVFFESYFIIYIL